MGLGRPRLDQRYTRGFHVQRGQDVPKDDGRLWVATGHRVRARQSCIAVAKRFCPAGRAGTARRRHLAGLAGGSRRLRSALAHPSYAHFAVERRQKRQLFPLRVFVEWRS